MPPKKKSNNQLIQTFNSVSSQTDFCNQEEFYYHKLIKVIEREKESYHSQLIAVQNENNILKKEVRNLKELYERTVIVKNNLTESSLKVGNEKVQSPGLKAKGCSCKGNCSNKICGCVKKGINCQEFCKCNDVQCKNQELDKENLVQAVLSKDDIKTLEKLENLSLHKDVHNKNKERSIFSPVIHQTEFNSENKSVFATPSTFISKRRLFSPNSNDIVDIEDNDEQGNSSIEESKCTDSTQNITIQEKIATPMPQSIYVTKRFKKLIPSKTEEKIDKTTEIDPVLDPKTRFENEDNMHINSISPELLVNENISKDNEVNLDNSLNPMMPKKQLARSPIAVVGNKNEIMVTNEIKHFSPPKKELAVENVDWEQHQSELIMCNICKRTFFPYRIEKHKIFCKGI